jgi:hypothetical protein
MSNEVGLRLKYRQRRYRVGRAIFPGLFHVMGEACRVEFFPAVHTGEPGTYSKRVGKRPRVFTRRCMNMIATENAGKFLNH